jgi:hypothetical protein
MMLKRIALCFVVLGLAAASAKTYWVRLYDTSNLGKSSLKAGEYKVNLTDTKVVLTRGKLTVESPVKVEKEARNYAETSVHYASADGKLRIHEIDLGSTNLKLVFE